MQKQIQEPTRREATMIKLVGDGGVEISQLGKKKQ